MMIAVTETSTIAQQIKRELSAYGYSVEIIQTPRKISGGSCGKSVRFDPELLSAFVALRNRRAIAVKEIYEEKRVGNQIEYTAVKWRQGGQK